MARRCIPQVRSDRLDPSGPDSTGSSPLPVGSDAWFAWLEGPLHTSFAYVGPPGTFTARREQRHGRWYWYAYRSRAGRLRKEYLGRPAELTAARLAAAADRLAESSSGAADRSSPADVRPSDQPPPAQLTAVAAVLATKLFAPRPPRDLVARPRLLGRLEAGRDTALTLVSAPAGAGKTTLLAAWLAHVDCPVAWLALDERDRDAHHFLRYLIAALQAVRPGCGRDALVWLDSPTPPAPDVVLTDVLNDLASPPAPGLLVLDDYHSVREQALHEMVAFLLDHLPPGLRLVLATREDPPLPLPRLRARGQLVELRAVDLRFSLGEAASFMAERLGVNLPPDQVAVVVERTEGWAAGLQLAALALRDRADPRAFVEAFAGSQRLVAEYLTAEVLDRQPAATRRFLLATGILERLCGPLCDALLAPDAAAADGAVTELGDGEATLEALEQANLFLVPLDEDGRWYRYHHLFAEALRSRLAREAGPAAAAALHQRASAWFEQQGLLGEAMEHALAAGAVERAADLVEQTARAQLFTTILGPVTGWLAALPAAVVEARPALALADAWRHIQTGDPTALERRIDAAERALDSGPATERDRDTRGETAATRALLELGRPEPSPGAVIDAAELALANLPSDNAHWIGVSDICLGSAYLLAGDAARAEAALTEAGRLGRAAGRADLVMGAASYLTAVQRTLGRRRRALATARQALAWVAEPGLTIPGRLDTLDLQLADLLREENDLAAAETYAAGSVAHFRRWGFRPKLCYSLLSLARVRQAAGDLDGALAALEEAQALAQGSPSWAVLDACAAQVQLAKGDLAAARRWVEQLTALTPAPRPAPVPLMVAYECEHLRIAPAQVWLAHGRAMDDQMAIQHALKLLANQRQAAVVLGLGWLRLKVATLEALAHHALGDQGRALALLEDAVNLAEPEGYVRPLADEGPQMAVLLTALRAAQARRGVSTRASPGYVARLLTACGGSGPSAAPALLDPLSARELEVLRLIARGQPNAEIAETLVVAGSTIKTHVKNIFGKLGVTSRTQAVARARALGLVH